MPSKRTIPRACGTCNASFLASIAAINQGGALYCKRTCRPRAAPLPPSAIGLSADGLTATVELSGRGGAVQGYAVIDAADVDIARPWHWYLGHKGYAERKGDDGTVRLHRQVLGLVRGDGLEGDHISRDKLDCRRDNLRILVKGRNQQNMPSKRGSSSVYRGVFWHKEARKWMAAVTVEGKTTNLGYFHDEAEAGAVALAARQRLLPFAVD
jgi:hypothetical protein